MYAAFPDHVAIGLNRLTTEARSRLDKVRTEGTAARRRANEIQRQLSAPAALDEGKAKLWRLADEQHVTRSKLAQLSSLVDKIDAKIVDLEARRDEVIDQRVAERLEGRPDASVKRVATLDAEVVIERAARDGAARALAAATERLQAIPELMRIERVKLAATAALRAELQWRQPHAVATRAAARYAAAQQMTGQIVQEVTLRPPAHMVAVAMRELETELFGAALPGDDSDSSCVRTRRHELLSRSR